MVHHELRQLQSDASWTSEDETQNGAKYQVYPSMSFFKLSEKEIFLPSYPSCLYHETLLGFSISGWLSHAVKSTNTNKKKIASGTLDTSQKLTCFFEN